MTRTVRVGRLPLGVGVIVHFPFGAVQLDAGDTRVGVTGDHLQLIDVRGVPCDTLGNNRDTERKVYLPRLRRCHIADTGR